MYVHTGGVCVACNNARYLFADNNSLKYHYKKTGHDVDKIKQQELSGINHNQSLSIVAQLSIVARLH